MEISTMEGAKENCERAMESLVTPYEIVVENIAVREGRRAFEVGNSKEDDCFFFFRFKMLFYSHRW